MDIIEQFAASTLPKKKSIIQDVKDYVIWETHQGEYEFTPQTSDDVAIRTYLLDCRIRGMSRLNSQPDFRFTGIFLCLAQDQRVDS